MTVGQINKKLKAQIVAHYGNQREFARALAAGEDVVSRVLRNRLNLTPEEKQTWAKALESTPESLFTA